MSTLSRNFSLIAKKLTSLVEVFLWALVCMCIVEVYLEGVSCPVAITLKVAGCVAATSIAFYILSIVCKVMDTLSSKRE